MLHEECSPTGAAAVLRLAQMKYRYLSQNAARGPRFCFCSKISATLSVSNMESNYYGWNLPFYVLLNKIMKFRHLVPLNQD